ncbi:MAG: Gfo/Idh/MocA family oxidoreductase [Solirubrobacterales bacterium]|nr:Gfo/Idh/MocA family oxidoreductase [Solirubrobacterales bacterium]
MKLLWSDNWIEVPAPHPVRGSALIEVEATVPILPLTLAHGRRIEQPLRKLASFAATDGPAAALRKARAKRAEHGYTGDYHLVAVLGRAVDGEGGGGGPRVVALAPRTARCSGWILLSEGLLRPVPESFDAEALRAFAAAVAPGANALRPLVGQSYLYSGMDPPAELTDALESALHRARGGEFHGAGVGSPLRPPSGSSSSERLVLSRSPTVAGGEGAPLAILGAGDYVRMEVAPALSGTSLERTVLCDREPQIAAQAAAELGFAIATTDPAGAIAALDRRGLVIIATAHDSHAALASAALEAGHRVFCEKPAVVSAGDLERLTEAIQRAPGELEVGFNRRYNPLVERARLRVLREAGPATIVASIREVDIEPDHWYLWPNQGTRVAGNLCHWIELVIHVLGPDAAPVTVSVSPRVSGEATGIDAERAYSIGFGDGSSASLVPTGRGDSVRGVQEQIEIRRGSLTLRLDDLWKLRGSSAGRPVRGRTLWRDKGHERMYREALDRFEAGRPAAYPEHDLRRVCEVQIALSELVIVDLPEGEVSELVERARGREGAAVS